MAKLPADVHLQIAWVTTNDIWEIDELLQVLRTKVESREISEGVKVYEMHSSITLSYQHRSTQNTSFSMVAQDIGNSSVASVYCRESHYSACCTKVTTISARQEILSKDGCYFACLMKGHCANECQSHEKWQKCGRKHHQSLCEQHPLAQLTKNNDSKETLPLLLQL